MPCLLLGACRQGAPRLCAPLSSAHRPIGGCRQCLSRERGYFQESAAAVLKAGLVCRKKFPRWDGVKPLTETVKRWKQAADEDEEVRELTGRSRPTRGGLSLSPRTRFFLCPGVPVRALCRTTGREEGLGFTPPPVSLVAASAQPSRLPL